MREMQREREGAHRRTPKEWRVTHRDSEGKKKWRWKKREEKRRHRCRRNTQRPLLKMGLWWGGETTDRSLDS